MRDKRPLDHNLFDLVVFNLLPNFEIVRQITYRWKMMLIFVLMNKRERRFLEIR